MTCCGQNVDYHLRRVVSRAKSVRISECGY